MVKYSIIGLSPSFSFVSRLMDEFDRNCILGFLVVFSFLVVVVDDNKIFVDSGSLENDESDFSILCVSFSIRDSASSR